jgi:hypothetical protein
MLHVLEHRLHSDRLLDLLLCLGGMSVAGFVNQEPKKKTHLDIIGIGVEKLLVVSDPVRNKQQSPLPARIVD